MHRTLLYHPAGQKFARNRSISYGFRDIHTFSFSAKIQDGRQKWRKLKFFPFACDTLVLPCGSKICCYGFRDIHFFIFRKNPRWPPKVAKLKIFPFYIGHLYYPADQKFAQNRSISYGFRDIHTFSFSAKIQDGRQKWRKIEIFPFCIGPSCSTLRVKNSLEISYGFRDNQVLPLKVTYLKENNQSSYYSVSYGLTAVKILQRYRTLKSR